MEFTAMGRLPLISQYYATAAPGCQPRPDNPGFPRQRRDPHRGLCPPATYAAGRRKAGTTLYPARGLVALRGIFVFPRERGLPTSFFSTPASLAGAAYLHVCQYIPRRFERIFHQGQVANADVS